MPKWTALRRLFNGHRHVSRNETSALGNDDPHDAPIPSGDDGNETTAKAIPPPLDHRSSTALTDISGAFTLSTCFGTVVFIDSQGRAAHGFRGEHARAYLVPVSERKALLCQYSEKTGNCFFIPVTIRDLAAPHEIALYDCSSGNPFTAEPLEKEQPVLASDRRRVGTWETFRQTLVEIPAAIAAQLYRPNAGPSRFGVFDRPITATESSLASALARLDLPAHPADLFWRLQHSALRDTFRAFHDFWLAESIPALQRWLEDRSNYRNKQRIGPECDWLANYQHSPNRPSFEANMMLRRSVRPRRGACILATARNEGVYLLEWIAHHRKLGFEHFFLYSNDNDDGSDLLLDCLSNAGIITWIRNELAAPVSPQVKAYGHALAVLPEILDYEWCLVIDIDEFLGLDADRFPDVRCYLSWQQAVEVDAIALNWVWFGTFGASSYQPGQLVTRRFYQRRPNVDKHIKSMIRPMSFFHSHPHYPKGVGGQGVFRDASGEIYEAAPEEFAFSKNPLETPAWIAHYWSKSLDEVLSKFNRGRGDMAMARQPEPIRLLSDVAHRVLQPERDVIPADDRRIIALVPDLEEEIAHLRSYPGIRRAEKLAEAEYLGLIADIRKNILELDPISFTNEGDAKWALSILRRGEA